jgi:hypothetical protein
MFSTAPPESCEPQQPIHILCVTGTFWNGLRRGSTIHDTIHHNPAISNVQDTSSKLSLQNKYGSGRAVLHHDYNANCQQIILKNPPGSYQAQCSVVTHRQLGEEPRHRLCRRLAASNETESGTKSCEWDKRATRNQHSNGTFATCTVHPQAVCRNPRYVAEYVQ